MLQFWQNETGRTLRAGENLICSPLRQERHPSFSLNTETGLFVDFGTGQGGDIFDFVKTKYGLDFPAAKKYVAEHGGPVDTAPGYTPRPAPVEKPVERAPADQFDTVEVSVNGFNNRGMFRKVKAITDIDPFGKPGFRDCGVSLFLQLPGIELYAAAHPNGQGKPSVAGYTGPVYTSCLFFDIDHSDLPTAQLHTIGLIERLSGHYNVPLDDISLWFSGRKGFHVLAKYGALVALGGRSDLPEIVKKLCSAIAGKIPLDLSIYTATHSIRVPNTINSKSGLYKIPILAGELYTLPLHEMQARARQQRSIENAKTEWMEKWNITYKQ